jgi:adenosine kinase
MVFRDRFKNHILPDQIHILNVAFLVPDMRREFGGCAGNIAYNLQMLGGEPLIMATVGDDYAPYDDSACRRLGLSQPHVRRCRSSFTAQAFITTDLDDNQITAFHPGAMNHSHENHVGDAAMSCSASSPPTGATACCSMRASSTKPASRSSSIPGRACRCSTARNCSPSSAWPEYVTVNDYEAQPAAGQDRHPGRATGQHGQGADRHANHRFTREEIGERYKAAFGHRPWQ